ncbi:putative DUF1640 domain-containing protein [Azospirillaceae bacterium]
MAVVAFDTLKLADKLQAGGFTAEQARTAASAFADAMSGSDLANKADLAQLATRDQFAAIDSKVVTLDSKIATLDSKIATLNSKIDLTTERLEERIERRGAESDSRMVRWVVGTGIAGVLTLGGIIAAAAWKLLQALPH